MVASSRHDSEGAQAVRRSGWGKSVTRTSLYPQPPSGPLPFIFGCSLPSQALPACCCCPTSAWSSFFVSMQLLVFFLNRSSDVQEKIRKANQPVRQHFLLLTPVRMPAESTPPGIRSHCSCAVFQIAGFNRQDGHEWGTFRFSSWLLGELSKNSVLP